MMKILVKVVNVDIYAIWDANTIPVRTWIPDTSGS